MEIELKAKDIPFVAQQPIAVQYKGVTLKKQYFADLVCFEQIIVEIKALARLSGTEQAQLLNYLKGTGFHPPPHQPSPAGSASATPPQGGSDMRLA